MSGSRRRRRTLELALTLLAPLLLLGLWEVFSRAGRLDPIFWPPPSQIWPAFWRLLREEDLLGDIRISLFRILAGFVLGSIPAVLLGLAMGMFWPVRLVMMPVATAIYAIPKIAILPLIIIAFGIGETSKVIIVALSIFFLVALNTMAGVVAIDRAYRDVARNLGAGPFALFWTVALPGALPSIFTGLRLALGFALIVIVGTEFLSPGRGIGYLIWESYQTLRIERMYVGLIVTGLMGWLLSVALDAIERVALPWHTSG
ncbi:MAG: ABC transporter permease [Chloroflexota bacterium]|nr:ABC transporter permease [Chloroflexota bacterium]